MARTRGTTNGDADPTYHPDRGDVDSDALWTGRAGHVSDEDGPEDEDAQLAIQLYARMQAQGVPPPPGDDDFAHDNGENAGNARMLERGLSTTLPPQEVVADIATQVDAIQKDVTDQQYVALMDSLQHAHKCCDSNDQRHDQAMQEQKDAAEQRARNPVPAPAPCLLTYRNNLGISIPPSDRLDEVCREVNSFVNAIQKIALKRCRVAVPKQVSDVFVQQGRDQAHAAFQDELAVVNTTYKRALDHSTEELNDSMGIAAKLKHELEEKTRELEVVKRQRSDANRRYARLVEGLKTLSGAHTHKHVEVE